jgi:hypothetical protein
LKPSEEDDAEMEVAREGVAKCMNAALSLITESTGMPKSVMGGGLILMTQGMDKARKTKYDYQRRLVLRLSLRYLMILISVPPSKVPQSVIDAIKGGKASKNKKKRKAKKNKSKKTAAEDGEENEGVENKTGEGEKEADDADEEVESGSVYESDGHADTGGETESENSQGEQDEEHAWAGREDKKSQGSREEGACRAEDQAGSDCGGGGSRHAGKIRK